MPISCHFGDCKALMFLNLTHVRSAGLRYLSDWFINLYCVAYCRSVCAMCTSQYDIIVNCRGIPAVQVQ